MADATDQQWTISRLLNWTADYFSKANADSPRLEAEVLLAESLGCARIELYTQFDQVPPQDAIDRFRQWVKRRGAGEPVAYIVGYREFYSLRFCVNSNVLIPRPETEHVIVAALEVSKAIDARPLRVLDVGTGSGCIAVTLAKYLDEAKIAAIDLSEGAIEVARANAESHQVTEKIRFFQGDLFDALPSGSAPVHIIVSNPPYIGTSEQDTVEQQVRDFEPHLALFAGPEGLDVIERLVREAPARLLEGGYLIFECSPLNVDRCVQLVADAGLTLQQVVKDMNGHRRVIVARKPG